MGAFDEQKHRWDDEIRYDDLIIYFNEVYMRAAAQSKNEKQNW